VTDIPLTITEAAEGLAFGIDKEPTLFDFVRFGHVRAHLVFLL